MGKTWYWYKLIIERIVMEIVDQEHIEALMSRVETLNKQVDYLRKVNEILWSYIPESDYELNEKISNEINEVEAK